RARPVSTGVPMTTAWSAARATRRVSASAPSATFWPRRAMRLLNSLRLGTIPAPLKVFLIKPLDEPNEVIQLLAFDTVDHSVLQNAQHRYRPEGHAGLPT